MAVEQIAVHQHTSLQPPEHPVKRFVKATAPGPLLHLVSNARRMVDERIQRPIRVKRWKRQLRDAQRVLPENAQVEMEGVVNSLPNSGGFKLNTQTADPRAIVEAGRDHVEKRALGITGFEGLALDDALGWLDEHKHYSFVPLARAVATIAHGHLCNRGFTTLELGCGWGGFRVLLQAFGCTAYLGVDANPLPFSYSPFMMESPSSYRLLNLQEKIDFGSKFDVVCSFEVLEHIPENVLHNLLSTIAIHLAPDSLFIGTAALTDYTDVHVTVRPRAWWLNRFREHGLVPIHPDREKSWLKLLATSHPFNWNPSTSSILVLHKT